MSKAALMSALPPPTQAQATKLLSCCPANQQDAAAAGIQDLATALSIPIDALVNWFVQDLLPIIQGGIGWTSFPAIISAVVKLIRILKGSGAIP